MQPTSAVKSFLAESALWTVSNALGVAVPVAATYVGLHLLMGLPLAAVSAAMSVVAVLTLTWGSWSSLIWARNPLLRGSMQMMTIIPGILLLLVAGLGFYVGWKFVPILVWVGLIATGVGTIAACFMLARQVGASAAADSPAGVLVGMGIFPLLATGGAGAVGFLWYVFVNNPLQTDWNSLFSFSFFFVTVLGVILVSSIVPAIATLVCRRLVAPSRP
jgi:hypothetical protein